MKIHDPDVREAHDRWWRDLTRKGDPIRRPDLATEAFIAGWFAAQEHINAATAEIAAVLEKMRNQQYW
jgi:hypothetical protein